jgi:DNA-binding NtrC family response regulator
MNFLIIENDQTTRDAIRFLVEDEGHSAEGAAASGQAWARLKAKDFDAVLLDLELAQTGGLLLEIARNQPDLPLIMYSAERSEEIAAEALRSGAMDFLEIPLQPKQFARALSQLERLRKTSRRIPPMDRDGAAKQIHAIKAMSPLKRIGRDETSGNTVPAKT